ncbi:MAG: MFS transporter [Chitinophagales bacterium]
MTNSSNNRNTLFRVFFTLFIDFFGFGLIAPVLPFVFSMNETGLFRDSFPPETLTFLYGIVIGGYSLGALFGSPILGMVSDWKGRRKILMFANLMSGIAYCLAGFGVYWVSFWFIFIGRLMSGVLGTTLNTVQAALADVSDDKSKAKNFGLTGVAFGLGFVTGVACMVFLSGFDWFSYDLAFLFGGLLNFSNILYIKFFFPETLQTKAPVRKISWLTGIHNAKKAFTYPKFRLIFMVIFMLTIALAFFSQFFQFYLIEEFDYNVRQVGLIFMYIGVLIALAQGVLLRPIANRLLPSKILSWSIPFFGLSFLLILLPKSTLMLYMVLPILIFFQGITFPSSLAIVSNLADDAIQGEVIGINQSIQSLCNALPAILFGAAVGFNVRFPMLFGAACCLIAWIIFVKFLKTIK